LAQVADALRSADIAVGNLEAQLFPGCPDLDGGMRLCAGPAAVRGLVHAGFDVVSVANNHSHNFGQRALDASIELLEKNGIAVAGYNRIPVLERGGTRFAFVAWTPVNRYSNIKRIRRQLKLARSRADVVVALVHWGNEYESEPIVDQTELAGYIAAGGADLIIGAHPHVVQPLVRVGDAQVAYSLGNFVFDSWMPEVTKLGAVGEFEFCGNALRSAELLPVRIEDPGRPRFVPPGEVAGWPPGSDARQEASARRCRPEVKKPL
jgi:poly-gamma-glutamate synthesis protein (capsule biosynthesis protein)